MPLVELGLVSRLDAEERVQSRPRASEREVRCAAGFYAGAAQAEAVAHALRDQQGLRNDQVQVIVPEGLTRDRFDRMAERWQRLRPDSGWLRQSAVVAASAATGMVTGGMAALVGWLVSGAPDTAQSHALTWLVPGLWAGALAGVATALIVHWRQPRHRFDETVARKLRRGYCAVVAHGLGESHEAPVLAYLQDTSHSWCAEAPRRSGRL